MVSFKFHSNIWTTPYQLCFNFSVLFFLHGTFEVRQMLDFLYHCSNGSSRSKVQGKHINIDQAVSIEKIYYWPATNYQISTYSSKLIRLRATVGSISPGKVLDGKPYHCGGVGYTTLSDTFLVLTLKPHHLHLRFPKSVSAILLCFLFAPELKKKKGCSKGISE